MVSVGPYRLLAPIGEGGMGVVHLAQAPDGSRVALKVLRPHIVGDVEARERLAREVSSLKRITSPRIAEIIDADPHGEVPYVVTRYVPGLSLYHHVAEEGAITGGDLLHFTDCLAEALLAVHSVGVLHRDVKPTNVLMEGRSPVLIDFGLARVAEDPRLTQTGWLLGTPGYLAPEILYGDDASPASDVHALAATVVFAATGRPPYGKGPAMAIMDRVRRGEHDLSGIDRTAAPGAARRARTGPPRAALAPRAPAVRRRCAAGRRRGPAATSDRRRAVDAAVPARPDPGDRPHRRGAADHCRSRPVPPAGLVADVPVREATPYQQPTPPPAPTPPTRVLPPEQRRPDQPFTPLGPPVPVRDPSRPQRLLQLVGLGLLAGATVAYAPYLGTALVALIVLLLRTASVTRQRHGRRRMVRGRARWYDVPATTVSTPLYAVLALFGSMVLVVSASLVGLAIFSVGYLFNQPVAPSLAVSGLGFAATLWWGPGSGRLREIDPRAGDADGAHGVRWLVRGRDERARGRRTARAAVQQRAELGAVRARSLALSRPTGQEIRKRRICA